MCHKILSGNGSKLAVAALVWFFFRVPVVSFHVHINSKFVEGSMTTYIAQIVLLFILNQSPSSHCRIWILSAITNYLWYLSVQSTLPWIMRINWKESEKRKEKKKTKEIPRRHRIIEFKHLKGQLGPSVIWAMHNISRLIYAESLVGLNHLLGLVGLMGLTVATCGYLFFGYSDNCLVVQLGSNPTTFHFCLISCL